MSEIGATTEAAARRSRRFDVGHLREYGIVLAFVVLFVVLSIASDSFLTKDNLLNLLEQNAPIGIMACAGAFVLIAGGLDLSVGALFTLAAILGSKVAGSDTALLGIAAGIAAGAGLGLFNALLVTFGRINTFIATITSGVVFAGLAQVITSGFLVSVPDPGFTDLGTTDLLGVKLSIWLFAAAALAGMFLLNRTTFGRRVFAVGSNSEAARLSGINVSFIKGMTFVLSGAAAGLAGMIVASRTASAGSEMGGGVEFDVVAAILLGGISVNGGEGGIWRAVIGVLLLALIDNGLTLVHVSPTYQEIIKGGIILAALALDARSRMALTKRG